MVQSPPPRLRLRPGVQRRERDPRPPRQERDDDEREQSEHHALRPALLVHPDCDLIESPDVLLVRVRVVRLVLVERAADGARGVVDVSQFGLPRELVPCAIGRGLGRVGVGGHGLMTCVSAATAWSESAARENRSAHARAWSSGTPFATKTFPPHTARAASALASSFVATFAGAYFTNHAHRRSSAGS